DVLRIPEYLLNFLDQTQLAVDKVKGRSSGDRFYPSDAGRNRTFREYLEKPYLAGSIYVGTSTKFNREVWIEGDYPYKLPIFFTKKSGCAHALGLLNGHISLFLQSDVFADLTVDDGFYRGYFFLCKFRIMRKVKPKQLLTDQRAFLLDMVSQDFLECCLQKMGGRVVVLNGLSPCGIYHCPELRFWIFRKFFHQVYRQVIFFLGIDDLDGLFVADQHTLIPYLSSAFGIKRCGGQHQLILATFSFFYLTVPANGGGTFHRIIANEPCAGILIH